MLIYHDHQSTPKGICICIRIYFLPHALCLCEYCDLHVTFSPVVARECQRSTCHVAVKKFCCQRSKMLFQVSLFLHSFFSNFLKRQSCDLHISTWAAAARGCAERFVAFSLLKHLDYASFLLAF